jgi:hypothetical protein
MLRLRLLRDYLIADGNFSLKDMSCHIAGSELDGMEEQTETGINLFEDQYSAVIYIADASEQEYDDLRLLLHDWFRDNGLDGERFSLSGDFISDVLSLVTIDLSLKEIVHLEEDPDGKIERDELFYSRGDDPAPVGI